LIFTQNTDKALQTAANPLNEISIF